MDISIATKNTTQKWKITRADGNFLTFTDEFELKEKSYKYRYKEQDLARNDGSVIIGDGSQDGTTKEFLFDPFAKESDRQAYIDLINNIEGFFRNDQRPYILQDIELQKEVEVVRSRHDIKPPDGNRNTTSKNTITFFCPKPKWKLVDANEEEFLNQVNSDTFQINNESNFDAFPLIEYTAVDQVVSFTLENVTMKAGFTYSSSDFSTGAILKANSSTGSITQGENDRSSQFTAGGLLRLLPGINNFVLTSLGTMNIKFTWNKRSVK
jgi:hypothetical protein